MVSGQTVVGSAVVIILLIGVYGFFYYQFPSTPPAPPTVSSSQHSSTGALASTSTAAGGVALGPVTIVYDNLTVGFHAGFWNIELQNSGTKTINTITVVASTPTETKVCTGGTSDLEFTNCPASNLGSGPLAPGSTILGEASGAGPGSATVGSQYPIHITLTFADGTSSTVNATVTATAAP